MMDSRIIRIPSMNLRWFRSLWQAHNEIKIRRDSDLRLNSMQRGDEVLGTESESWSGSAYDGQTPHIIAIMKDLRSRKIMRL